MKVTCLLSMSMSNNTSLRSEVHQSIFPPIKSDSARSPLQPKVREMPQLLRPTKSIPMRPHGFIQDLNEVPRAGIVQELQSGPMRCRASGTSHRITHIVSLSCIPPHAQAKPIRSKANKKHIPRTGKKIHGLPVELVEGCAEVALIMPGIPKLHTGSDGSYGAPHFYSTYPQMQEARLSTLPLLPKIFRRIDTFVRKTGCPSIATATPKLSVSSPNPSCPHGAASHVSLGLQPLL